MENKLFTKVYGWMFIGLLISFITGYFVSTNETMVYNIAKSYIILVLVEMGLCIGLSAGIRSMNKITAQILYILYTFFTGLTFSILFFVFKLSSITMVFGITSLAFGIMAVIGSLTKIDISKFGNILLMGLIAIIIASIINIFVNSQLFDLGITIIGIVIFMLYIAYDVAKIKMTAEYLEEDKAAILCAFELYLDFINIFVKLLRLFGKSKD